MKPTLLLTTLAALLTLGMSFNAAAGGGHYGQGHDRHHYGGPPVYGKAYGHYGKTKHRRDNHRHHRRYGKAGHRGHGRFHGHAGHRHGPVRHDRYWCPVRRAWIITPRPGYRSGGITLHFGF